MAGLDDVYEDAGRAWNVDPNLLRAIGAGESGGLGDSATSNKGAEGRMQLMPPTARGLGVTNTRDPVQSIFGAAKLMASNLDDAKGDVVTALRLYQGGPDRSIWGPQNAAYPAYIMSHYRKVVGQSAPPSPQDEVIKAAVDRARAGVAGGSVSHDASDDELIGALTKGAPSTGAASPTVAPHDLSDDDLLKRLTTGADAPQPAAPTATTDTSPIVVDDQGRVISGSMEGTRQATSQAGEALRKAGSLTDADIRSALAPAPNTTYGSVLPYAEDNTTGALRFAMPGFVRDLAQGAYDLSQGPATGTVTPAASATLAQLAMGGMGGSVAAGTGARIGGRLLAPGDAALGRNEVPDLLGSLRAAPALNPDSLVPSMTGAAEVNRLVPKAAPTATAAPQPGMGEPAPNSVGAAAASPGEANMSAAEIQAYRSTAEGRKYLEPQPVGVRDNKAYVPGVEPTSAETEQSVNVARELKALGQAHTEVSQEAKAVAAANNEARTEHFGRLDGSDVDLDNAKTARKAQAERDLTVTWRNKTDADPQVVFNKAAEIIASPDGRRPVVRNAVNSVISELRGADGQPVTDPELLYGVRKHIDDLMSKEAGADDPKSVRARASLQAIKDELDGVIEAAAPGFRQYLDNFSNASRRIDEMEVLQKHEKSLFDKDGVMQHGRVQNMMRQIVDSRRAPGINPYKSISDETMQELWNLRDDLRRSSTAGKLATTSGSDTAQNLMDVARLGGNALLHGGANMVAPGIGSMVLSGAKQAFSPILAARVARKQTARGMDLLRPNRSANPLIDPRVD